LQKGQAIHVGTDDFELLRLLGAHQAVDGGLDFGGVGFAAPVDERPDVKAAVRVQQKLLSDCGRAFAEHVREYTVELDVGNRQAVLGAVLLPAREIREFAPIPDKVAQLAHCGRQNKAAGNKAVLEDVRNSLGVAHVGFLAPDCLGVLWAHKNDATCSFEAVVERDPILPGGLHANVAALIVRQSHAASSRRSLVNVENLRFLAAATVRRESVTCHNRGNTRRYGL
jgi:hypothetical protein